MRKEKVCETYDESLPSAVGKLLIKKKRTLALAESCTGGLAAHRVTDVPGSSRYFLGGIVSYSDRVKSSMLGVDARLIKRHGAVSAPVAMAMAQGVRRALGASIGVAITGIAGPAGGSAKKPVGLVYIAVAGLPAGGLMAGLGKTFAQKCLFFGSRSDIKSRSADKALDILRLLLMGKRPRKT